MTTTATERPVIVFDASAALAWLLDESAPAWATALWESVMRGRVDVKVPDLFWLEIGNRYVRRRDLADEQVLEGILRLEALGFQTIEMDRSLRLMAIHLARRFGLSTYDALYLALADMSDLPLATLDRRLGAAAATIGRRYGDAPGPAIGETPASYGTDRVADPMSLATLGAYLAELRQEIPDGRLTRRRPARRGLVSRGRAAGSRPSGRPNCPPGRERIDRSATAGSGSRDPPGHPAPGRRHR